MDWEQVQQNWETLKGRAKQRWTKLGEEQLTAIAGRRIFLLSRIREVYQVSEKEAERQVIVWQDTLGPRK